MRSRLFLAVSVLAALALLLSVQPASARPQLPQYNRVDLGTLGGDHSYAYAMNDLGQVVGYSVVDRVYFNQHAFLWQDGQMIDLGGGHYTGSWAYGINNLGQVVGRIDYEAFIWEDGVLTRLGDLLGPSEAADINDRGEIVGRYYPDPASNWPRAFLLENGQLTDQGTLGGEMSEALAINNRGEVVGYSYSQGAVGWEAFLWKDGKMYNLGALTGYDYSQAYDINDRGTVVGFDLLWKGLRGFTRLGRLGCPNVMAYAVNRRNWIVGDVSSPETNYTNRAFVCAAGMMALLPSPDGGGFARDINMHGQVAGWSSVEGAPDQVHATVWNPIR